MADGGSSISKRSKVLPSGNDPLTSSGDSTGALYAEMMARIAARNRRLEIHVAGQRTSSASTATLVMNALDQERGRIARELHAGAGQPLAGIRLHLQLLAKYTSDLPAAAQSTLSQLHQLADDALQQVRAVSHRNHPPDWQRMELLPALETLLANCGIRQQMSFSADLSDLQVEPPYGVRLAIYRCAQECLSNMIRHSGATEGGLRLKVTSQEATLNVYDNGKGFDAEQTRGNGIGLRAIRSWVEDMGGKCLMERRQPGTTISVTVPLYED